MKRSYYPPDAKPLAEACLVRMTQLRRLGRQSIKRLLAESRSAFRGFPVEKYFKRS